jgi:translation elongation factor EF-Ts
MDYLVSNAGKKELTQLLSHHMVNRVMKSTDLAANNSTTAVNSMQGAPLKIVKSTDGKVKVNGIATVETADVVSSILHNNNRIPSRNTMRPSHHHVAFFPCSMSFKVGE